VSGVFDTITNCSITRGAGQMLIITLTGTLDGSAATLTLDQNVFSPGVVVYPATPLPAADKELRSDIGFTTDTSKGSWRFYSFLPADAVGGGGGTIGVVETNGDTLDVTIDAKYGTTDASGPVNVKGEFTCTESP
jgi:hypothetical protein